MAIDRQRLDDLRTRLLRLHAMLLARERRAYEDLYGPITSAAFLQLLIGDERFAWLRPLSSIIAAIEETLEDEDSSDESVAMFVTRTRKLLRSGETGTFDEHYHAALQESPDIVMAHADVVKLL